MRTCRPTAHREGVSGSAEARARSFLVILCRCAQLPSGVSASTVEGALTGIMPTRTVKNGRTQATMVRSDMDTAISAPGDGIDLVARFDGLAKFDRLAKFDGLAKCD